MIVSNDIAVAVRAYLSTIDYYADNEVDIRAEYNANLPTVYRSLVVEESPEVHEISTMFKCTIIFKIFSYLPEDTVDKVNFYAVSKQVISDIYNMEKSPSLINAHLVENAINGIIINAEAGASGVAIDNADYYVRTLEMEVMYESS